MRDTADLLLELNRVVIQRDILIERVTELQTQRVLDRARIAELEGTRPLLTRKEMRVLIMLAQGYENPQIAMRCNVSVSTIRTHTHFIFRKLKVRDRLQAARYAWQHGIVRPDEAWETVMTNQWRDVPKAVGAK